MYLLVRGVAATKHGGRVECWRTYPARKAPSKASIEVDWLSLGERTPRDFGIKSSRGTPTTGCEHSKRTGIVGSYALLESSRLRCFQIWLCGDCPVFLFFGAA